MGKNMGEYSKKMRLFQKIEKFHFWLIFCQFLPILCILNHVLLVKEGLGTYFQFDVFLIYII
jgi:hypothetical protein